MSSKSNHQATSQGLETPVSEFLTGGGGEESGMLRLIADAMPALIAYVDNGRRYRFINKEYEQWFGLKRDEAIGRTISDVLGEESQQKVEPYIRRVLAGEDLRFEAEIQYQKAGRKWVEARYIPDSDEDGGVRGFFALIVDITERKDLEAKTLQQFEELENIYSTVPVGLAVIDTELRFVRVNEWLAKLNGVPASEHAGRPVREVVPQLAEKAREIMSRVIETGEPVRDVIIEGEAPGQPAGQRAWSEIWTPVKNAAGETIAVNVVVEDVTEGRWAETLMVEQNRLFEMIAAARPLETVLTELTAVIDRLQPNSRSVVLVADLDRSEFEAAYAANIPETYLDPLRGVKIEAKPVGTCCEAVYKGVPVTSTDVASDMRWTEVWRDLCLSHDIKACHSEPIVGEDGRPLGTVVLGFDTPREPDERGLRLVRLGSQVAGVAIERSRAEQALRESESEYRTLFDSIDEGYCVVEVICDERDRPVDYRFVQINPAFAAHTGLPVNSVGRTARELVPGLEDHWVETYGRVALTGEPERFENGSDPMGGRWFDVYALRVGAPDQRRVGILFNDITERKRRELDLTLLAEIATEFSHDLTAERIIRFVGERLGSHLGISDCLFSEIDEQADKLRIETAWTVGNSRKLTGEHRLSEYVTPIFREAARRGEPIVSRDTGSDPRVDAAAHAAFGIGSFVTVPFKRAGEWKYLFTVNNAEPRDWRDEEIELVREVANRLFPRIERARAEAALRVSEERLRLATEAAGIYTWEYDPSTGVTHYSPNMRSVLGFELPSNTGNANLYIHAHDRDRVMSDLAACLDGDTIWSEYRFVNPATGETSWVATHGMLIPTNGRPARAVGITQNITERKRAEEVLRMSRDTFRLLVENSPFGIYVVDADFKLAQVAAGAQKVFQNVQPHIGRDFAEVLRIVWEEPFATDAINLFRHTLETGEPYHSPRTIETRGDIEEVESYDWRIERIAMPDGRFGVVCHFYDLSERLQYETALRESEELLASTFSGVEAAIAISEVIDGGREFRILGVNRACAEWTGIPAEDWVGRRLQEFLPRSTADAVTERYGAAVREGRAMDYEEIVTMPAGDIWALTTVTPLHDERGAVTRVVATSVNITRRKEAEQALQESEERYRVLFETMDEGFCVIEFLDGPHGPMSDYVHVVANPALAANSGIPDIVGRKMREMVPDEADGWVETYRNVLVTGEPVRFQRELAATGRHLELAAFRIGPAERRQVAVLFKDITGAKRAEEELRKQTELLRAITESTPDLIYAKDASGRMIMANKATLEAMGQTEATAIGRLDSELYDPLEADLIMANDRRVMQSGRTETVEEVVTTGDDTRTYLTTKNPLRDAEGRVIGVVGVSHDITALKRAETALRDSETRHRLALESGNMGTWTMPMDGSACWADEQTLALFDIPVEDWTGDAALIRARRLPEDQEEVNRALAKAIAERSTWRSEFRVRRRDGSIRWLAGVGRIEFGRRGEPVLMRGINFDITERKQAEQELRSYHEVLEATVKERTRELAEANRELNKENRQRRLVEVERQRLLRQLVAAQEEERRRIAQDLHDHLGQQLTALNLKLELALQAAVDGDLVHLHDAKAIIRQIDDDVDALAWQLRPAILDDGFLPALRKYVEDWSRRCGVRAELWADGHFENRNGLSPEAETNLYRITQEALNNVAKYARAGRVEVLLNKRGDSVVLTVQDDGAGFDVRAVNAKSMGLIGMRERAGMVGGTFEVESSPGEGTAVYVRVPFTAADGINGDDPAAGS